MEELIVDTGMEKRKKKGLGDRYVAFLMRNWSWLLPVVVVFIFMLVVSVIMSVAPFGTNSLSCIDSIHQYVPFFSDYQRKIRGFEGLSYTWNIGMGQNFASLFTYYLGSPLNLLMLLVPRSGILSIFTFLVTFKLCFSAGAFGYWLSRRRGTPSNNFMISAFSLGFAFSNYMMGYHWNVMWLDCIMMLPLAILGLERIIRRESPKMYVLSLFYILYCNYYIAFIICIFLILWFLAHRQGGVKAFFRNTLVFAGWSILSALMAAFSLLTAFCGIMQTSSAGKMGLPKEELYGSFFAQLKQHLFLTIPIDMNNDDSGLNAYCGVLAVLLFFLFLLSDRISLVEKIRKLLLVALLIYSFNSTLLNFIWHGFHNQYGIPNRFSFVYIFVLLSVGYEAMVRLRQTGVFRIALAGSFTVIFFFACYWYGDPKGVLGGGWMLAITLALVIVYMVFLFIRKVGRMSLLVNSTVIFCLVATELMTNGALGFMKNDVADGGYYTEHGEVMAKAKENVDRYSEMKGLLFWREDQVSTRMIDEATYNGFRSVGTFCSTVGGDLVEAMGRLGCYTGVNEFLYYGATPALNMLMGVRYIYAKDDDFAGIATRETPIYDEDHVRVYENPYVLPIAYAVPSSFAKWNLSAGDRTGAINAMVQEMTGVSRVYESVTPELHSEGVGCETWVTTSSSKVVNYEKDKNFGSNIEIVVNFTIDQEGSYVFDSKVSHLSKLKIEKNGVQLERGRFFTQLIDLGKLKTGDQITMTFEFDSDATDDGTVSLLLSRINEEKLKEAYDILADEGLEVTYVKDGKVDGVVTMKEDGLLFTSIPYDEGWSVEVDGETVKPLKVGSAFLAVSLTKGQHTLKFRYSAPGFKTGLLLSVFGWIVYIAFFHLKKLIKTKKKKNEKAESLALHNEEKAI